MRDAGGQLLTELERRAGCSELVWLRDYLYVGGEPVGALHNNTLAAPDILAGYVCETQLSLYFGEADWHDCRSLGVNVYRREQASGVYDFTAPQNPSPIPAWCADGEYGTQYGETVTSGSYCYVLRSVHLSGELGPVSEEACFMFPGDPCTPPPPPACYEPPAIPPPSYKARYYFTDHLGTVRGVVRSDGDRVESIKVAPFGEVVKVASCAQARVFTGHERDRDTGLDYMHARYYDRGIGRFLATDPVRNADLANPQGWSAYAYVLSNPLRYIDPDGRLGLLSWIWAKWDQVFDKVEQAATIEVPPDTRTQEEREIAAEVGAPDRKAAQQQVSANVAGAIRIVVETGAKGGVGRLIGRAARYKGHLTKKDLDAARREAAGEVVARKSRGAAYDHVTEVREARCSTYPHGPAS